MFFFSPRYHKDLKEDICVFSGFLEILTLVFFFPRIFQDPDNLCFFFFSSCFFSTGPSLTIVPRMEWEGNEGAGDVVGGNETSFFHIILLFPTIL